MTSKAPKPPAKPGARQAQSGRSQKQERLGKALRDNLARRKKRSG